VVKWATEALDEVRRQSWNEARRLARRTEPSRGRGRPPADAPPREASPKAKALKGARFALWKNPQDLTERQHTKLARIANTDPKLHRAYQLKEGLRVVFQLPYDEAGEALDRWVGWARRCRIPAFVKLQKSIVAHRSSILAAIEHGLSKRTDRVRQPEDPTHHQNRLRLHLPPRSHRPRHAQPRRAPPCPARPNLTHTSVRSTFSARRPLRSRRVARRGRLGGRRCRTLAKAREG